MNQTGSFVQHNLLNIIKLSKRIKINEGYRNNIYKDNLGFLTIGYGHRIKNYDKFIGKKKYSKKILNLVFINDLKKAIYDFKNNYNTTALPNNVQEVIIEMVFQMGIRSTLKFNKFNSYIKKKLYYLAALEMIKSRWYHQTPKRVERLIEILLENNVRRKRKSR